MIMFQWLASSLVLSSPKGVQRKGVFIRPLFLHPSSPSVDELRLLLIVGSDKIMKTKKSNETKIEGWYHDMKRAKESKTMDLHRKRNSLNDSYSKSIDNEKKSLYLLQQIKIVDDEIILRSLLKHD